MQNPNPYAAPSAPVADVGQATGDGNFVPGGRPVASGNGWQWIVSGWELFKMNPGIWIANVVILFALLMVMAVIPIIGQVGGQLLLPVFVGGLMLGCRALANDQPFEVGHLVAGFREKFGPLFLLGVFYMLASLVIIIVVAGVFGFGLFAAAITSKASVALSSIVMMGLIILALSVPLAMAIWFSPALSTQMSAQPVGASWSRTR